MIFTCFTFDYVFKTRKAILGIDFHVIFRRNELSSRYVNVEIHRSQEEYFVEDGHDGWNGQRNHRDNNKQGQASVAGKWVQCVTYI